MMLHSQSFVRPTAELLRRAAETSLTSARLIAQSMELITRSVALLQKAALAGERRSLHRLQVLRTTVGTARPAPRATTVGTIDRALLLPLTAPRLLELAEEFRDLATTATTPESRAAFEDLVFRYMALAAGYDDQRVGSRMMH
jgi:hypothetical protein